MTGDRQGDGPQRRSGRHSRVPREYDDPDPQAAPGQYGPPDPPGSYAGPDRYPQPDPYPYGPRGPRPAPDAYAGPDAYPGPDAYAAPGPYRPDDAYPGPDAYAAPGRYPPEDAPTPADGYALTDRYVVPDPGAPAHPSQRPEAYGQPGYPAQGPLSPLPDHRDPRAAAPTGPYEQNGYGQPGSYEPPPFRWQPPPDATGPQRPAGGPGQRGETGHHSSRGAGNWDPFPEPDRNAGRETGGFTGPRRGQQDTGPGPRPQPPRAQPPRSQPPGPRPQPPGARPARPRTRQEAAPPQARDDAPSPAGLIPGFWDSPESGRGKARRPRRRMGWVLAPLLALALLCAMAVGGYDVYKRLQSKDFTGPGFGHVTVQVMPGDTATSLAPRLVTLGVVASTKSFISAAKQSSNPAGLQPGFFSLHKHMNSALAYRMLLNPASRIQSKVTIPEGLRMSAILTTLEKKSAGTIPASAFAAAAKDIAALGLPPYAGGHPEGYLFPATYDFNPGTSALGMLQAMVARFNQEATSLNLTAAAQAAHMTPARIITVASLIQAEAGNPKYFRDVAEVIYNRLNDGMKLGMQSTVNFVLHKSDIHLTVSQLKVNSPYNTYIHTGLPPGPINSPGDAAIQAALHPNHGNLLYFVTVNLQTGLTKFTSSPAQFQQFVAECRQNNAC